MDREQQRQQKPAVLITGAAGNIGQTLACALADDYRIIGLDRSPADVVDHAYVADITSADSVTEAFNNIADEQGKNLAAVIHLAAYFDFTGEDSPLYEQVNPQGTRHLLHALAPFTIERFIYSSTMLVHQPGSPGDKITESTPLEPRWAYPQSKADVEALIEKEIGPTPYTILRLAGVYDEHTAVPTLAHQIARIYELDFKSKVYAGDTAAGQAFLHKQDMVAAFKRTLEKRQQLPQRHALLIGESECLSYAELQNRIGELIHHQRKWRTLSLPTPVAKVGAWLQEKTEPLVPDDFDHGEKPFIRPFMIDMASDHYDLDISAAHTQLDWQPKFSLYITLEKLVANLKADAAQWYAANRITPPTWLSEASELHKDPNKVLDIHQQRYQREHQSNLWGSFMIIGLGAWLISAPPVMSYTGTLMAISDLITGFALIIFALFALSWQNGWARWINALLGLWLLAAPLVFWTHNATAYYSSSQEFSQSRRAIIRDTLGGSMALPWNLALCVALGIWLMLTRITLGHTGTMANWDHLVGALVITLAVCSFAEVSRSLRFLIAPLAVLLGIVGVFYAPSVLSVIATLACALVLILLSLPRGKMSSQFGSWRGNRY